MVKHPTSEVFVKAKEGNAEITHSDLTQKMFEVTRLAGRAYTSPLVKIKREFVDKMIIHDEETRIMYDPRPQQEKGTGDVLLANGSAEYGYQNSKIYPVSQSPFLLKLAAPRISLHFNPEKSVVGIVTCGGLCPGLNDVVRGLTLASIISYHVNKVIGFRYGYWGLSRAGRDSAIELTPDTVRPIHCHGGTILGSSRGGQKVSEMVDTLIHYNVNILFTVGGDGTQKGALMISKEIERRGLDIAVFGIPKTIDNDLSFSHRTFGYETAVDQAVHAIRAAFAEANSHKYGIGVVKLMGRHSGFIAAQATVASMQANICLIPEQPITKETFLKLLKRRFCSQKYCVVVVAEGFGQNWEECNSDLGTDASGNKRLADIGIVIKNTCEKLLKSDKKYNLGTVKYIDPSYMIRACPPSSSDASFCSNLSTLAVHEAMAGCTGCLISQWYSNFVVVPIKLAVSLRKIVSLTGSLWRQVREVTVDLDGDMKESERRGKERTLLSLTHQADKVRKELAKL